MKVVHYSTTAVAGAPYQIWKCLKKYTDLDVRLIQERNSYPDKRSFPTDILLHLNRSEATKLIKEADIIHIHNYLFPTIRNLVNKKKQKVVATFHSTPRLGSGKALFDFADINFCIDQPAQIREYKECKPLPTLFDIYEHTIGNRNQNSIVYAPTNKYKNQYPASKGYEDVLRGFKELRQTNNSVKIDIIEKTKYFQNLQRKQNSSILIDDIVPEHNTFHLTTLEGCCFGLCILTGVGKDEGFPFIKESVNTFVTTLKRLLQNPSEVEDLGNKNREWIQNYRDPKKQVEQYLEIYYSLFK
tara:strand:+ start:597 stop:1496 length:900 start_codon:yes stop_codon:yes gene_type:complete